MRYPAVLLLLACAACAGPKPRAALRPPAPECMTRYCFHDGQRLRCAQLCPPPPVRYSSTCGDGWCVGDAELASCRADCFCGNGACQGLETNDSCPADCKCGDGVCDPSESAATCPDDCRCPGVAALGGSATLTLQAVMPSGGYRCLTRGGVGPARP
jgi:hypothetical protein